MVPISKPTLPAKRGYVEVCDNKGNHYYEPTSEQILKDEQQKEYEALDKENSELTSKLNAAIISNQILEDCVVEMASVVYA